MERFKPRQQLTFVVMALIAASSTAQSIDEELNGIRSQYNLVGMVAGVACNGATTLEHYGGVRNLTSSAPIDANTYFRIASISKSFSASGLMRLYDAGAFQLDDDISNALGYEVRNPSFPQVPITYRMVLSHTASLQDGGGYGNFLNATVSTNDPPSIEEVLFPGGAYYTANMWRTEAPGTHFAYSNMTYCLLGTLVEALSSTRFDVFMKEQVLEPLGISGSFNVADISDIGNVSVLYRNSNPQVDNFGGLPPPAFNNPDYVPGTNGARFGPQGGLRTNLQGLLTFGNMLVYNGQHNDETFLDSSTVALMLEPQWTFNGSNGDNYFGLFNSWGLGIHRSLGLTGNGTGDAIVPGIPMAGHAGEAYGLVSDLFVHPETKYVCAFLTNGYLSGGNYAFGLNTTFYQVEESVFEILAAGPWPACEATLGTNTRSYVKTEVCNHLFFDHYHQKWSVADAIGHCRAEVYSMDGRQLWKGVAGDLGQLSRLPGGVLLLRLYDGSSAAPCALKFVVN